MKLEFVINNQHLRLRDVVTKEEVENIDIIRFNFSHSYDRRPEYDLTISSLIPLQVIDETISTIYVVANNYRDFKYYRDSHQRPNTTYKPIVVTEQVYGLRNIKFVFTERAADNPNFYDIVQLIRLCNS